MKKMLVTGGCGFIGSNFIRHILNVEAELFSLDGKKRFYYKSSKKLEFASELGKEIGEILKKESKNSYKK